MRSKKPSKGTLGRVVKAVADEIARKPTTHEPGNRAARKRGVVAPEDERGVPYPGDWPNPVADKTRGCF